MKPRVLSALWALMLISAGALAQEPPAPAEEEAPASEQAPAPQESTDEATSSATSETKEQATQQPSEETQPTDSTEVATEDSATSSTTTEGKGYFFQDNEINGSGGSLFVLYTIIPPKSAHNIYFGGKFYFLFNSIFRLGAQAGIIRPLVTSDPNGYTVGAVADLLARVDPVVFEFGLNLGYGQYGGASYLNLYPQFGLALRITKEFAISFATGYLIFLDASVVSEPQKILDVAQATAGIYLTFGAF